MKGLETNAVSEKAKKASYGIVFTSWNADIVQELLLEAKKELIKQGVNEANIVIKEVPGAFELPLASKVVAEANNVSCVISIGAIIIRLIEASKIMDTVYVLTSGGPGTSTETSSFYIFIKGLREFQMGYA